MIRVTFMRRAPGVYQVTLGYKKESPAWPKNKMPTKPQIDLGQLMYHQLMYHLLPVSRLSRAAFHGDS